MEHTPKRRGKELGVRTFSGKSGNTYIVFRSLDGSYHAFVEVEAKKAARDCGASPGSNTRTEWQSIWDEPDDAANGDEPAREEESNQIPERFSPEFEERLSWDEKAIKQLVILNPEDRPKEDDAR